MSLHQPRKRPAPKAIFQRLPGGRGAPSPTEVAAHQRARLEGAMVEGVRRHGYRALTIRDLCGLAAVSRISFYAQFGSKEDCFLATLDKIAIQGARRVEAQTSGAEGLAGDLLGGLGDFAEILAEKPAAAHLALVDSLSLGAAGVLGRDAAAEHFEAPLAVAMASAGRPVEQPQVRWIVAGLRHAAYRALRDGTPERLGAERADLVDWALACCGAETVTVPASSVSEGRQEPGWSAPIRPSGTRPVGDRRPRLLRATAQIATEQGYTALSIPAVSKRARTSNAVFYQHFDSTEDAFLAAFEELWGLAFERVSAAAAGQPDRRRRIAAAVATLLDHLAREPVLARLAFFELTASGPAGLDRADAALGTLMSLLWPPSADAPELSTAGRQATAGALWAAIQHELTHDRADDLSRLAPRLTTFALAPPPA